jgi:acyl carrier protein
MLEEVQEIFRDVFDDEELTITNGTGSGDIEDWDSLSHIRLIVALEKHFSIKFAFGELNDLKNVGEMLELIKEKKAE